MYTLTNKCTHLLKYFEYDILIHFIDIQRHMKIMHMTSNVIYRCTKKF